MSGRRYDFERLSIGYFVSAHGFGHASRAAAVMAAIQTACPAAYFHVFTTIPDWFFLDSLGKDFSYQYCQTDIGLIQKGPLEEDLPATIEKLNRFLPFTPSRTDTLCQLVAEIGCRMIISDISPLGIHIAGRLNLPSILIENFTWDWIYAAYAEKASEFEKHIDYLNSIFKKADFHIQTEPVCQRQFSDLCVGPISRQIKTSRQVIRQRLDIPEERPVILVTMGGISARLDFLERLPERPDIYFIIPGGGEVKTRMKNTVCLPHHSDFFHPDLVHAVDGVIGKAGYSTIAEVYHAGIPFGFVLRPKFRESQKLAEFIQRNMPGLSIETEEFHSGEWLSRLDELLSLPRVAIERTNGAHQVANFMAGHPSLFSGERKAGF